MNNPFAMFAALLVGHALADYPLQGPFLSDSKRRRSALGANGQWIWSLLSHGAIHAGFVWYLTGVPLFAAGELIAHVLIDFAKCERRIGTNTDQVLHVVCKLIWVLLAFGLFR